MSKTVKAWIIAAACLVVIGLIMFAAAMSACDWDFTKLGTEKYETNTHEVRENFTDISITTDTANISFVATEDGECKVVCYESEKIRHEVRVEDGSLIINVVDDRRWYEYIGINFATPKITVYLPEKEYGALSIHSSTGHTDIPKEFKFKSVDISQSTGDVTSYASVKDQLKIKTSTGDIHVESIYAETIVLSVSTGHVTLTDAHCAGNIDITVSTGKAQVTDVECLSFNTKGSTGNIDLTNVIAEEKISATRTTGDVTFHCSDAPNIVVNTDTGDVSGTLNTEKVFICETDTGHIDVPKTTGGGKCEITTDTGDIKIKLSEK